MKTLLSFLMTIFCAALISAADLYYGFFTFPTGAGFVPVCYNYASYNGGATPGAVDEPLVKNEIFRVCLVRDKRGKNVNERSDPAVTIDAAGQLVLGENAAGAKWATLRWTPYGTLEVKEAPFITVGETLGAPSTKIADDGAITNYGFSVFTDEDVAKATDGKSYNVYMYLVAMDTRTGEGTCCDDNTPMHVKSYAMALCYGANGQAYINKESSSPRAWYVNATGGILVFSPGLELAWKPAAEITSLAVTQDGVEKVLTGDDLKKYLTPEVTAFAQTTVEGETTLTLTANAPDVQYYTLYTKEKLSDASWTKFEEYAKTLDNVDGKYYTRFRIDGKSLSIPLVHGEASRFYMLRGE